MTDKRKSKAAKLRVLQERFIKELPSRVDEMLNQWHECKAGANPKEFHRLVHSLSGAAGTFGFKRLGEQARNVETLVQQQGDSLVSSESISEIDDAFNKLCNISEQGPDKPAPAEEILPPIEVEKGERQSLIYVLEDDNNLGEEIVQQLQHFGYMGQLFHTVDSLKAGFVKQKPDAILADIHLPEGVTAGPQAVIDLSKLTTQDVPVIFISGHSAWQDRLAAVRAGGRAYLSKPINFNLLFEELDTILGKREESPFRILVVDDMPLLAQHYASVLEASGMVTKTINDPSQLLDELPLFRPDLILMDIYLQDCTGVETAQVIRQVGGYTNLPIVYLSTEKGVQKQLEALRVGGDDFLQKPISDSHLVEAVLMRAHRFRDLTSLMIRDSLTGLLNHINLKLSLEQELAQAQRRSSPLCFVMLDIDHFKAVNDSYGHPVGDQVIKSLARLLKQRLRKSDIVARYGGEEFAVILPDTRIEDAQRVINELRRQFAQITFAHEGGEFNATLSAGIAASQAHRDMEALIAHADCALYKAKDGGRNCVNLDDADIHSSGGIGNG